jgi:predicted DCC family thiol-disulfide oxidoreductase YuxK
MLHPILLYDGVCGLCNRFVQFTLRRDRSATFRFASLQSNLAAHVLARHSADPAALDTVYVVLNHELRYESLLSRSDAVHFVLKQLGGFPRAAAAALQILPTFLRNAAYNTLAGHRYRIFGRSDTCILPDDQDRPRFLDQ